MVYLFVGFGGIIGSVLRYFLSVKMAPLSVGGFPYSTLMVNLLGTFLLGMLATLFKKFHIPTSIQQGLNVGLIGSFTTFSAFTTEFILLIDEQQFVYALLYIFVSTIGGFLFAWVGMKLMYSFFVLKRGREAS